MEDKLAVFLTVCSDALRAEDAAMDRLTGKAEKYVAAIGVILAFLTAEMQLLSFRAGCTSEIFSVLVVAGVVLLLIALAASVASMRVREYPTFSDSEYLMRLADADTDDRARRSVAKLYLELRDGIRRVNERRALTLRVAGIAFTAGYVVSLFGHLGLALFRSH
jgi:cytochrome c-type biogenesis protein CcmH/NrfG